MLTIHLGQDENDCFAAWVSAKEAGINVTDDNLRGNKCSVLDYNL